MGRVVVLIGCECSDGPCSRLAGPAADGIGIIAVTARTWVGPVNSLLAVVFFGCVLCYVTELSRGAGTGKWGEWLIPPRLVSSRFVANATSLGVTLPNLGLHGLGRRFISICGRATARAHSTAVRGLCRDHLGVRPVKGYIYVLTEMLTLRLVLITSLLLVANVTAQNFSSLRAYERFREILLKAFGSSGSPSALRWRNEGQQPQEYLQTSLMELQGNTANVPCQGNTATVPCQGKSANVPCQGKTDTVPCQGNTATVPCQGKTANVPCQGKTATVSCQVALAKYRPKMYLAVIEMASQWILFNDLGIRGVTIEEVSKYRGISPASAKRGAAIEAVIKYRGISPASRWRGVAIKLVSKYRGVSPASAKRGAAIEAVIKYRGVSPASTWRGVAIKLLNGRFDRETCCCLVRGGHSELEQLNGALVPKSSVAKFLDDILQVLRPS
uniref:Uncharacterized protein n=1 Tax=Timema monikensis TaxID=170555 RepID=A0A7R9EDC0_9NEOP|nr:unnamed protein product [Timema monikensis]